MTIAIMKSPFSLKAMIDHDNINKEIYKAPVDIRSYVSKDIAGIWDIL